MATGLRVDKWLWAARFFKTRSLSKSAIESGKVKIAGQKIKPSRQVDIDTLITVRQGLDDKIVRILCLSEQRRGATEAQTLYAETEESRVRREKDQAARNALNQTVPQSIRPNKKQRRQIYQFLDS